MKQWLANHRLMAALVGVGLLALLVPVVGGVVGGGETVYAAAIAQEAEDHMTVYAGVDPGLFSSCPEEAEVTITRDDIIVYPSMFGKIDLENCEGTIDIPYRKFVDRNGMYTAHLEMGEHTAQTPFSVEKVVNWVYVRSFPNATEERTRVEIALSQSRGQPIHSSLFTSGELVLDVYWEDCSGDGPIGVGLGVLNETSDCSADHDKVFHESIHLETTAITSVIIPWDNFDSDKFEEDRPDEGLYNVTATFHNLEAKGNNNVPMDPTVFDEDPSGNWFEVSYD